MFVREATTDVRLVTTLSGLRRDVYLDSHVAGLLGPSASTPRNNKLTLLTLYATQPNFCAFCSFFFFGCVDCLVGLLVASETAEGKLLLGFSIKPRSLDW